MKKFISILILTATLTFPLFASALSTTPPFSDVTSTNPNFIAITKLKDEGVISGYPDGTFKPNQAVNRVEALKMILLGSGLNNFSKIITPTNFSDIDKTQWYMPYLRAAVSKNIVSGYPDGSFKPTQTVNLVESLKMVIRTNKINLNKIIVSKTLYADTPINQWYTKYIQYAKNLNLIDANAQNKVFPDQSMTRGKLAELMYRQLEVNTLNKPPTSNQNPNQNSDKNTVVYQINIKNNTYSIKNLLVPIGTTVNWTNNDTITHTVIFDDSTIASSGNINANGGTFQTTFNKEGTFTYQCTLHPNMKGVITVKPVNQVPTI